MQIYDEYLTEEFLAEWIESTVRIIGAGLKKKGVVVSDPSSPNIRLRLLQKTAGYAEIHFIYRDSLRFTEMGAGRGYHKGQRITQAQYRQEIAKGRKRKKILMKPIYGRLASLQQVVAAKVIQDIQNDFQILAP